MANSFKDLLLIENIDSLAGMPDLQQGYLYIVYAMKGTLQVNYNQQVLTLEAGDFLVCMPSVIIGNYMRTPDFEAKVVCAGKHLFDDVLSNCYYMEPQWWEKEQYVLHHPVVHMTDAQRDLMEAYLQLLRAYQQCESNPYRERIMRLSGQAAASEILGMLEHKNTEEKSDPEQRKHFGPQDLLFQRFCDLVGKYGETQREVRWYADQLLVSPKYLSLVCKQKTGYTASEYMADTALGFIRHYLGQTDLSVKEICFRMNFPDVSFFCKYTRRLLGMSPLAYRNSVRSISKA